MAKKRLGLIVPDVHAPYHDKEAVELVLKVGQKLRPDFIVVLGDFADFYSVSSHSKDPRRSRLLLDEAAEAKALLDRFAFLSKERYFVEGNHEYRLDRYLQERAPELHGTVSVASLLGLKKWKTTPYGKTLKLGKLHITHDLGKSGKGAAAHAMQSYQGNSLIGHVHRAEVSYQGNARGEQHVGASFGWLGDYDAIDYRHSHMARREWTHAFGTVTVDSDGVAFVFAHPIVKGRTCVHGNIYKAAA